MTKLRFESTQHEAWARLLRTQRRVTDAVQAALHAAGLPPLEWYDVLIELKTAPQKRLRQQELGEKVVLAKSNLTRLIDRMENAGLVERVKCAEDARGKFAAITREGEQMLRRMWPVYRQVLDERFAGRLSEKEGRQLASLLERMG